MHYITNGRRCSNSVIISCDYVYLCKCLWRWFIYNYKTCSIDPTCSIGFNELYLSCLICYCTAQNFGSRKNLADLVVYNQTAKVLYAINYSPSWFAVLCSHSSSFFPPKGFWGSILICQYSQSPKFCVLKITYVYM